MAAFTLRITAGATVLDWIDATGVLPSRLNPTTGISHKYYRVAPGTTITCKCDLPAGGSEGAIDSVFGGAFVWEWSESPSRVRPIITTPVGNTSIALMTIANPGHYLLGAYHPTRGAVFVHITCE
jgi:hypothetical protein